MRDRRGVADVGEIDIRKGHGNRGRQRTGVGLLGQILLRNRIDHRGIVGAGDLNGNSLRAGRMGRIGHRDRVDQPYFFTDREIVKNA